MKAQVSNREERALTLMETLFTFMMLAMLAMLLLAGLASGKRKHSRIGCVNNLKQLGLSFRIWGGDNGDKYPMQVSETNGGTMERTMNGDALAIFKCMSNEIGSARILHCYDDSSRTAATNFSDLQGKISYFVNVDVSDAYPQMILTGDNNLEIGGVPVKPGLLEVFSNTPIAWTSARHKYHGNLGIADGSVQQVTQSGLRQELELARDATNLPAIRFAIP